MERQESRIFDFPQAMSPYTIATGIHLLQWFAPVHSAHLTPGPRPKANSYRRCKIVNICNFNRVYKVFKNSIVLIPCYRRHATWSLPNQTYGRSPGNSRSPSSRLCRLKLSTHTFGVSSEPISARSRLSNFCNPTSLAAI